MLLLSSSLMLPSFNSFVSCLTRFLSSSRCLSTASSFSRSNYCDLFIRVFQIFCYLASLLPIFQQLAFDILERRAAYCGLFLCDRQFSLSASAVSLLCSLFFSLLTSLWRAFIPLLPFIKRSINLSTNN